MYAIFKDDPVKYILLRLVLNAKLVKWAVILEQYDLAHVSKKKLKGKHCGIS